MAKYEIWWIEKNGDDFFTGDYFYLYENAFEEIGRLNNMGDDSRAFFIKKINLTNSL